MYSPIDAWQGIIEHLKMPDYAQEDINERRSGIAIR